MGEVIVDEEMFIASFGERQYQLAKQYLAAKELFKGIKNASEIGRQLNYSKRTIHAWLFEGHVPYAIRSLNFLKSIGLMPLINTNDKKFLLFTELSAFVFGDGSLGRALQHISLFGQKEDLEKIAFKLNEIYNIKPKFNYFTTCSSTKKIRNGKVHESVLRGGCWRLSVNTSPLARLLYLAGIPSGDKVSTSTQVPKWIVAGNKKIKRAFLSVLFGNELQCPSLRAKNAFSSPQLGFHKIEPKEENLRIFLTQIRNLLREFGISTSPIAVENCKTIRKDGNFSKKLYFSIDSHSPNILRLFKEIPFKYAEEKQRRLAEAVKTFLQNSKWLKQEWRLYEKVMQMHDNDLGRRIIFKQLQLPKEYLYKINAWIHYGQKPLYYNNKEIFT